MTATVLSNIQMNPTDGLSPVLVRSTTKLASGRPRVPFDTGRDMATLLSRSLENDRTV